MGGGPTSQQKSAAARQEQIAQQEGQIAVERNQREKGIYNQIMPFATERMQNGLPFYNALTDYNSEKNARAWAPARADIIRRTESMGDQPSGFREAALRDLEAKRARSFDEDLTNALMANEQAKMQAAGLLTGQQQMADPSAFYGQAASANNSIMNAPLRSAGWGGLLGGAVGGGMSALPF